MGKKIKRSGRLQVERRNGRRSSEREREREREMQSFLFQVSRHNGCRRGHVRACCSLDEKRERERSLRVGGASRLRFHSSSCSSIATTSSTSSTRRTRRRRRRERVVETKSYVRDNRLEEEESASSPTSPSSQAASEPAPPSLQELRGEMESFLQRNVTSETSSSEGMMSAIVSPVSLEMKEQTEK